MSITREQAATWFETMHPPGPAAREMYRMAAEALNKMGLLGKETEDKNEQHQPENHPGKTQAVAE